jgi:hypothetical protein
VVVVEGDSMLPVYRCVAQDVYGRLNETVIETGKRVELLCGLDPSGLGP